MRTVANGTSFPGERVFTTETPVPGATGVDRTQRSSQGILTRVAEFDGLLPSGVVNRH